MENVEAIFAEMRAELAWTRASCVVLASAVFLLTASHSATVWCAGAGDSLGALVGYGSPAGSRSGVGDAGRGGGKIFGGGGGKMNGGGGGGVEWGWIAHALGLLLAAVLSFVAGRLVLDRRSLHTVRWCKLKSIC